MKNLEIIKAAKKQQIMKLLDFCDCFTYSEEYIDEWLDMWANACSPQIEAIAEKSQYYDGDCKVVFPAEYPRELNIGGINTFRDWLCHFPERNLEELTFNGYTYAQAKQARKFFDFISTAMSYKNSVLGTEVKSITDIFNSENYHDDMQTCYDAYKKFDDAYYYDNIRLINHKAYSNNDYEENGSIAARNLSDILGCEEYHVQFVTDKLKEVLTYYFGSKCRFSVGQKLSRAVNNIAQKYGIAKDKDWNREFAKFADSINPLTVTKWTVLSWDPIDYLTFCFGNSWSTCSTIDKRNRRGVRIGESSHSSVTSYVDDDYEFRGEHCAAALSYMFDKSSFIYYTVNHKYEGTEYESQDKESRIVFSLNEDMDTLLETRLYPQCNDDVEDDSNYRIPREIVQKVIADALEVPNLWKMKKGRDTCVKYARSTGVHYPDYEDSRNKECNISWRGDTPKLIKIGHDAICPNCGEVHTHLSSLNCADCDPMY